MPIDHEIGSTDHGLLRLLPNLNNQLEWETFLSRYRPMIRLCFSGSGLKPEEMDEVESQVYVRLVQFFTKTESDIKKSFRGLLSRIVDNEIKEFMRQKRRYQDVQLTVDPADLNKLDLLECDRARLNEVEVEIFSSLEQLNRVLEMVKRRVEPQTWSIYYDFTIQEMSATEVSEKHGVSISAVYKYQKRVASLLKEIVNQMN